MKMNAIDDAELRDIRWHWGTAYVLDHDGERRYTATRVGLPDHVLTADTAAQLRGMIRSDYFEWFAPSLQQRGSLPPPGT
jgi:hypothetical protein